MFGVKHNRNGFGPTGKSTLLRVYSSFVISPALSEEQNRRRLDTNTGRFNTVVEPSDPPLPAAARQPRVYLSTGKKSRDCHSMISTKDIDLAMKKSGLVLLAAFCLTSLAFARQQALEREERVPREFQQIEGADK